MDKNLLVGLGGALGAMLRYLISIIPLNSEFPVLTLIVNLIGAVAIGFIVGMTAHMSASQNLILFLKVGVCGGFTTFSTFSLESVKLLENGKISLGIIYIVLSIGLCLCGVFSGRTLCTLCFNK